MKVNCKNLILTLALVPSVALAQISPRTTESIQTTQTSQPQVRTQNTPAAPDFQPELILHDGTPVRLRLSRTLSSEHVKQGDQIDFDVMDDVSARGHVVIARGSTAIGSVTEAEHKRRMGRGGKLNLVLDYVRLEDGTKVALRAEHDAKGGGHVGAMSAGIAAAVVFGFGLPAPLILLMHGKEAVVPQGTELTAYVNGDTRFNIPTIIQASR